MFAQSGPASKAHLLQMLKHQKNTFARSSLEKIFQETVENRE
jgi:hypothetical protein